MENRAHMTVKSMLAAIVVASALVWAAPAGSAALAASDEDAAERIVAGPGGFVAPGTYATPVAATRQGETVIFHNFDIAQHDVLSEEKNKKGRPLFRSKLVGAAQETPVTGTDKLKPGTYDFYCSAHHWMQGQLVVQ